MAPPFAPILKKALARVGGEDGLAPLLPVPRSAADLAAAGDDRYLSDMCRRVFRAGLRHTMVDARWPAFEEAFHGFAPGRIVLMDDGELEACMANPALIRHWAKIVSVRANAAAMRAISARRGGFGRWLADWPADDTVGLWERLAKDFRQLGGASGPSFLRMVGKDTFMLTGDTARGLIDNGIVAGKPTSRGDRRRVQDAFNAWSAETGRPQCQLSRILALSAG